MAEVTYTAVGKMFTIDPGKSKTRTWKPPAKVVGYFATATPQVVGEQSQTRVVAVSITNVTYTAEENVKTGVSTVRVKIQVTNQGPDVAEVVVWQTSVVG